MNQTGEVSRRLGPPFLARGGPRRRPWLPKATKWIPKGCPPEAQVQSAHTNMVPLKAKGAQHHAPEPQTWCHLGPRCPTSRPGTPETLRPSLSRAPKREPKVLKIHASGRLRGAITETLAKPLHNDTPCVLGRHASRRPPHTGKSSQACFVRTDHTASSQGHPSHMPQPVHPISYAKAISLQHTSSSHPDHTSSN